MKKLKTLKASATLLVLMAMTAGLPDRIEAFEFRQFSSIAPPQLKGKPGAKQAPELKPIPRAAIHKAVNDFFAAWNAGQVDSLLAPEFVDKSRLLDAITDTVPRDAKIRVLSIRSVSTLPRQLIEELPGGKGFDRLSTVTATVETQIEFTDSNGFQKIKGVSDYLFKVREEYR